MKITKRTRLLSSSGIIRRRSSSNYLSSCYYNNPSICSKSYQSKRDYNSSSSPENNNGQEQQGDFPILTLFRITKVVSDKEQIMYELHHPKAEKPAVVGKVRWDQVYSVNVRTTTNDPQTMPDLFLDFYDEKSTAVLGQTTEIPIPLTIPLHQEIPGVEDLRSQILARPGLAHLVFLQAHQIKQNGIHALYFNEKKSEGRMVDASLPENRIRMQELGTRAFYLTEIFPTFNLAQNKTEQL